MVYSQMLMSGTIKAKTDLVAYIKQIPVKPVYTKQDLEGMEHLNYTDGLPPFLRGPYSTMYVMRPWTIGNMPASQLPKSLMHSIAVT